MHRPSAAVLLLTGLIAADVVLVTGAVRSTHVDTSQLAQATETETSSAAAGVSSAGTTAPTSAAAKASAGKVTVLAFNDNNAWRAASPSVICTPDGKPAKVDRSTDGGKHWTDVKVPLNTVSTLSYADNHVLAIGTDSSCQPATYALSASGSPQESTTNPAWAINPKLPIKLQKSGKSVAEQPCSGPILDIATNSKSDVVALCANHSIQHSTDSGDTWKQLGDAAGVVAIATGNDTVYTATEAKCGISVTALAKSKPTDCVAGTKDWSGPVDMTIVGGTMWLVTTDDAITEPVSQLS